MRAEHEAAQGPFSKKGFWAAGLGLRFVVKGLGLKVQG